jgi:hypothetical protein
MLILLDIDGVMLKAASWRKVESLSDGFFAFEPIAVSSLQKIISETGASIVLTSSHKSKFSSQQWKLIFEKRGVNVSKVSCLVDNVNNLNRKDEIINWFNNGVNEDFVIIDDDKGLNGLPPFLKEKCVITGSLSGLNNEAANNAINILHRNLVTA